MAALVKLACETDFVGKNEEFITLARDLAMQVVATSPSFITREEVDEATIAKAKEVFQSEVKDKPAELQEKIIAGKLDSYLKVRILLEQPFIKNPDQTINDLVIGSVQKFGENITISEISRLSLK